MNKRKLLITGCGRSGTKYISELLKCCGFDIGHEKDGKDGIASWPMAVSDDESPWGPPSNDYEFENVIHQVRHPFKTISSCLTISDKSWNYIKKHIPINDSDSKIIMSAKYWYYWNLKAEGKAKFTYKIEDIESVLPQIIINFLKEKKFDKEKMCYCLKEISKRTNERNHELVLP